MITLSASRLELLARCPAAGALPAVWTESTDDQVAGTARHRYLQRCREVGREVALGEVPADAPWRAQCEALDVDALPAGDYEIAWAYDTATDTARCLGPWLDRAYEVSDSEVSGTADLLCPPTAERPRWLVVDFKGEEEVPPAGVNLQLGLYALCVARSLGLDEVDVAICYLRQGGGMRWDRATLGPFELGALATRVCEVHRAVQSARELVLHGQTPDLVTGLHCRRCASLTLCPAQVRFARELLAAPLPPEGLAQLDDADAGRAWVQLKVLGELVDQARACLDERAKIRGLPLPDGGRLVPVEQQRRALLLDRAEVVLRELFGAQLDAVVERSLSTDAVNRLARQLAPGKGQKRAAEEVWEKLDAAGAVRRTTFVQLRTKPSAGGSAP